ncbi:MAG: GYD domain-containing protein [Chloroflexi bacterium]|nr:GYD domain-containing protein [Chloroflexota bacterium]
MPIYIQLLTLTADGRERVYRDPQSIVNAQDSIHIQGVQLLGQYAVLGDYDYVNIVEARDNETIAVFSLYLGVRVGAHVTTLPTIPVGRFEALEEEQSPELETGVQLRVPGGGQAV